MSRKIGEERKGKEEGRREKRQDQKERSEKK